MYLGKDVYKRMRVFVNIYLVVLRLVRHNTMKHILIFIAIFWTTISSGQKDTTHVNRLREQILILSNKVDEVRRDQINYSIEKNLLKETYSNNFDKINLVLTAILGIFAVLTFFGIRDINSIKRDYKEELEKLRRLQSDVETKSKEFDLSKKKYDEEITQIIKQNEDQNRKIKVLEIKEKISNLSKDKQYGSALEYCAVGIELSPTDLTLLAQKGVILGKLHRFAEAAEAYEKVLTVDSSHSQAVSNITELYFFLNQIEKAKTLISSHPSCFNDRQDLKLLDFFNLIKNYHASDIEGMKSFAKSIIDSKNPATQKQFKGWDFSDALNFSFYEEDSVKKDIFRQILSYLNGSIKGTDLDKALGLGLFPGL
jgi:tetratricopeptide (TPR) repeat protein